MGERDRATWLTNAAPAVFVVAAGMIAAGAYLIDPAIADLGFDLRAERTVVVGAFLTFAGVVLALSVVPQALETDNAMVNLALQMVLGKLSLMVLAFIELAVGAQALFTEPRNDWGALLLIPGLLSLAISFTSDTKEEAPPDADDEPATSDSGKVDVAASARFGLIYAVYYALAMGAMVVWIAFATWVYYRLSGAVLDGETFDLASYGQSLWLVLQDTWPAATALVLLSAVLIVGAVMAGPLAGWASHGRTRDGNRDLTNDEIAFINTATAQTQTYAQAQGYDRSNWVIQTITFITVIGTIVIGGALAISGINVLEAPAGPFFPIERRGAASAIVFIFVVIFLSAVPNSLLTRLSRRYAERMGWATISENSERHALKRHLTARVRAHRLSSTATFHPGDVLAAASRPFERFFYAGAAALTVVALFLFHRDTNAVDRVTANEIEIIDYWTLAHHRFAYTDVRQVVIRYFLTNKGETVESYELQLPGGRSLDLYRNAKDFEAQIAAYEAVDAKLAAIGVPFVPGAHKGLTKGDERGYETACVDQVANEFPPHLKERVRRFFHVDTLAATETIWPWNPQLAKAATAADLYQVDEAVALYTNAIDAGNVSPRMIAVAYTGRALARENYELAYGIRDAQMILALADYRKARELDPTVDAYRNEAWAYVVLGGYDEAEAVYRRALAVEPTPHWSLLGLARVERIRGNHDAALKHVDAALSISHESKGTMPIFYHRARVLSLKGDDAGVVDAITKGLAHQTNYADAFHRRACARARLGQFAQAAEDMEQTIKLAAATPLSEAWTKTPYAKTYHADHARDLAAIKAMTAGTASKDDRATLCRPTMNDGENPRPRSPLLPPQ